MSWANSELNPSSSRQQSHANGEYDGWIPGGNDQNPSGHRLDSAKEHLFLLRKVHKLHSGCQRQIQSSQPWIIINKIIHRHIQGTSSSIQPLPATAAKWGFLKYLEMGDPKIINKLAIFNGETNGEKGSPSTGESPYPCIHHVVAHFCSPMREAH